jgi:hypothetical protein
LIPESTDAIVSWEVCTTGDPAIDVGVTGTHTGLALNAAVYQIIAQRLRRPKL